MSETDPSETVPEDTLHIELLRAEYREDEVPPLLRKALDKVPDAWQLLWAQGELARIGDPSQLRRAIGIRPDRGFIPAAIRAEIEELARQSPSKVVEKIQSLDLPRRDADLWSAVFRVNLAEQILEYLARRGCRFDFEKGRLSLPSGGGAPPSLYRELVCALDRELRRERPRLSPELRRERMASVLSPFFARTLVTLDSRGPLARTQGNC